ncbi:cysteine/glutathione ABC transporter permease/ATP-binding protein CydD [Shewanella sp. A25]|nr:cysteine/glutathione ABC transporter permease/ATP-binding protein CydD [Shewanella shenzhenensis]
MDKSLEKSLLVWLKSQKKACGPYLNLSVFCGLLSAVALIAQAYFIASILDNVIITSQLIPALGTAPASLSVNQLLPQLLALIGLMLLRSFLAYVRERASFTAGKRLRQQIRHQVTDKLTKLGPAFIKGKPAGSWASIVLEQVDDLQDFYARYLPQMILAAVIPLLILGVVFPMNWAAGLILLLTAPLIPLFMALVGMGAADANRKNFDALAKLSGHFMDRLKGLATLKLFFRGEAELQNIASASEEFRSRTMAVLRMAFLSSAVLEFFAAVSIAVLAVYFGFSYLGHLDFGYYGEHAFIGPNANEGLPFSLFIGLFILILAPEFYQPLRDMGTHYHAKAQAIGAAEALMTLLAHPEPNLQGRECIDGVKSIKAENLVVLSIDGERLLGPISFSLNQGEHLALVGPSGAGKTSLLNALLGFLPYEGCLQINGVELSSLDLSRWRNHLAWLGQEPQLFHGTVRSNISLANPELADEAIWALLEKAHIKDFVINHPLGLDAGVGEQASQLSVGQAQRLALARALGQGAELFILDEPTASLDNVSEQLLSHSLDEAMAGKMAIVVTHRLDTLNQMDSILVLERGEIVQQGKFAELAASQGLFLNMLHDHADSISDVSLGVESSDVIATEPQLQTQNNEQGEAK